MSAMLPLLEAPPRSSPSLCRHVCRFSVFAVFILVPSIAGVITAMIVCPEFHFSEQVFFKRGQTPGQLADGLLITLSESTDQQNVTTMGVATEVYPEPDVPLSEQIQSDPQVQKIFQDYFNGRFQQNNSTCMNELRSCDVIYEWECVHKCEQASFHRIESCLVPTYGLLEKVRATSDSNNTTTCLLYDKDGFLSDKTFAYFQKGLPKHVKVIPYNVPTRSVRHDHCYSTSKLDDRSLCFNTKPEAEVISSMDMCNGTCSATDLPHIVRDIQQDLSHTWGPFHKPEKRDTVVLIARPHDQKRPDSRSFHDLAAVEAMLRPAFNVKVYNGSTPSLSKETAELFASAKVVLGYHGAGFTNLVYSHTNRSTVAIEMFARGCSYGHYFNQRIARWGMSWRQLVIGDYTKALNNTRNGVPYCKYIDSVAYNQADLGLILREVCDAFDRKDVLSR